MNLDFDITFGTLAPFMIDPTIEEIWINSPERIFIARAGRSELTNLLLTSDEVRNIVERALMWSGRRLDLSHPFVDALVTATLRGAPLVEVLTRHASEARSVQRNRVLSAAGKAEISMMIPVVFLILPISILFALWPSLANLNLFAT